MVSTDPLELEPYLAAGYDLIPLHRHDYFDEYKGKRRERGKSPLHNKWRHRQYGPGSQTKHLEDGGNVGVRLRDTDLVIDVDPRNFAEGDDPFVRLCGDVGLDPDDHPTVETGSGGLHLYMTKPADVAVRDSLDAYPGVEFKSVGRQVVAAGSLHPTTKRVYRWDFLRPDASDVHAAPQRLVNLIRRPSSTPASGGGEYEADEIAAMLDALDPEDFRDHGEWLALMQACHHASGGDARAEFVEWSTRDPHYRDDGGVIGRRWDSLHADADGSRVTYRTLHKALRDRGLEHSIPRTPPEDDFEAVGPDDRPSDLPAEHERKGPLERMNDKYWAVMEGSQFRVMYEQKDPTQDPPRRYWVRARPADFKYYLANRRVQRGESVVPLSEAWLEWGGRRTAEGVIFDPEHEHPDLLNLWTGWGVAPKKGDWSRLDELLSDALCDGDSDVYDYVMNWAAHMVQRPGRPAETAVCFQGGRGVGKGTWGRALCSIAGRHGMPITSSEHLTGRFNAHLRDVILLFADEAIKPYDKEAESRLKGLITEPRLAFEGKGRDVETDLNRLHIVMASNEEWFVPMALEGERRFLLQRANNLWERKMGRFSALNKQLRDGGLSALLFDLLNRDLGGWSPRDSIPNTDAAVDQKLRNLAPVPGWWLNVLQEGTTPGEPVAPGNTDWSAGPVRVLKQDVRTSFEEHCRRNGFKSGGSNRSLEMMFAKDLKRVVPGLSPRLRVRVPDDRPDVRTHADGHAWAYELPSLGDCRRAIDSLLNASFEWSPTNGDDLGFLD